jgi:hypothetical protein
LLLVQVVWEILPEVLHVPEQTDQILRFPFLRERLLQVAVVAVAAKTAAAHVQLMEYLAHQVAAAVLVCHGHALVAVVRMPQTMTQQHSETTVAIRPPLVATTPEAAVVALVVLAETVRVMETGPSVAPAVLAKHQRLQAQL